jgi:glycosyltransferase involved in cell wall biosynthesis
MNECMKVTVIVCTYNRCKSLARALESVAASELPDSIEWEVLVVDNNSRDHTREVVNEFCLRHPKRTRYIFEKEQGLSNARNAGIRQARGEIVAFVDDDVSVEPAWLGSLVASLDDTQWAGCGGRVLPEPGFSPPPWLAIDGPLNLLGALCAYFDPGDSPGALDRPPIGANMAFRKEMFEKYGGFRKDLGHCGDSLVGNEDTEFGRRLMAAGERLRYEPFAVVYHSVPEERLNRRYFREWWFGLGRGSILEPGRIPGTTEILRIVARIILATPMWLLDIDPQHRFYRKCRIWYEAGKIAAVFQLMGRGNAKAALP